MYFRCSSFIIATLSLRFLADIYSFVAEQLPFSPKPQNPEAGSRADKDCQNYANYHQTNTVTDSIAPRVQRNP
jgi:hypothetical protein